MAAAIREATDADLPALAGLRRAWTTELASAAGRRVEGGPADQDDPAFAQEFARWWEAEAHRRTAWIAETDGAAVGMLNVLDFRRMPRPGVPASLWGYVSNVYVLPAHRGRGTAAALLAVVAREAARRRYARLVLSPSEASRPLYRRAGYLPAGDGLLIAHLSD